MNRILWAVLLCAASAASASDFLEPADVGALSESVAGTAQGIEQRSCDVVKVVRVTECDARKLVFNRVHRYWWYESSFAAAYENCEGVVASKLYQFPEERPSTSGGNPFTDAVSGAGGPTSRWVHQSEEAALSECRMERKRFDVLVGSRVRKSTLNLAPLE